MLFILEMDYSICDGLIWLNR